VGEARHAEQLRRLRLGQPERAATSPQIRSGDIARAALIRAEFVAGVAGNC
jgi:hypothetical protein